MTGNSAGIDQRLSEPDFWLGNDQDATFAEFRESAPLSWQEEPSTDWHPHGGPGYWSATTHELVREISRRPESFGSRYGTEVDDGTPEILEGAGMLNMDAPDHTRLRNIVSRVFTPAKIGELSAKINDRSETLVDNLVAMGEFDFAAEVGDTFAAGIIVDVMGVPAEDLPRLVQLTKEILSPPMEQALTSNEEMIAYGIEHARLRVDEPRNDLLSLLVHADADGERLTERELGVFFALLLTAGVETTGTTLNHSAIALANHPEQRRFLLEDYDGRSKTAVEELIRWASPVRRFRRTALEDTELNGIPISQGQKVVMWYGSANRDASAFESPHLLDLSRNPNPHVAFGGGGPHFCLGANLARAEINAFLKRFLSRMPNYRLTAAPTFAQNDAFNAVASVPCSAS